MTRHEISKRYSRPCNRLYAFKEHKGKELTKEQKQTNQVISSIRVIVEYAIGGAKRCHIIKDRFRYHKLGFLWFGDGISLWSP